MFAIIQAIPGPLVKLFNRDPAALEESIRCLRYLSLMAFPSAFFFIYVAIATASGFTVFSMFCHVLDGVVVRVALSLLLTKVFGMGLVGVYLGMGLAPTLSAIFAGAYFYSGAWKSASCWNRIHKQKIQQISSKPGEICCFFMWFL